MSEGDAALSDGLAASYDDWYPTPLGALAGVAGSSADPARRDMSKERYT